MFIIETKLDEDVNENEEINGQTKNDQTSTSEHPNRFFVSIATQTSQEFLHVSHCSIQFYNNLLH